MGALIPIAIRLFSRILIALVAWSFTVIGHNIDLKLNQSTSTPPQLNISPLFVGVQEKNSSSTQNKIEQFASTTNSTSTVENLKPVKKEMKKVVQKTPSPISKPQPKISTPVPLPQNTTPTNPSVVKENPSLKDIPTPSIDIPQITNEINKQFSFGEWNNVFNNSENSVVNIFCVSTKGNLVSISTGSGVILSGGGIILTNSHVAENFLIPNKDCVVRQGGTASDKYNASLVYINESWLQRNAQSLFSSGARGTGEDDFALLLVNSNSDGTDAGQNISHTNISTDELTENNKGNKILVAGYPAGGIDAISMRKYLSFTADVTDIANVYTIDGTHVDVIETDATKVGQHGSSGGGIFDANSNLVGLIFSVNDESRNSKINAITIPYINRTIKNESGKSLQDFMTTDKNSLISSFTQKQNSLFQYVKPYIQ